MGNIISRNIKVSNTEDKPLYGVIIDQSPFGDYNIIEATYPTAFSEIYTYKLDAATIGTVTVTYTNSSKKDLSSVVYNAV